MTRVPDKIRAWKYINMDINTIPKIDLHCHLDGSISPDIVRLWLLDRGEEIELSEIRRRMTAPPVCSTVEEYLSCFDLPKRCMQDGKLLKYAAYQLALEAAREGVVYMEIRFSPGASLKDGLTFSQAIEDVEAGLAVVRAEKGIGTGIICCGMQHVPPEENIQMLHAAAEHLGRGVVACDMTGDGGQGLENLPEDFFDCAKKLGIPAVAHVSRRGSAEGIRKALKLGCVRIGHGLAMQGNPELQKECAQAGAGVELCPTGNIQTRAADSLQAIPLREFQNAGLKVSVCTGHRTIAHTDSTTELEKLQETLSLTEEELHRIYDSYVADCEAMLEKKYSNK